MIYFAKRNYSIEKSSTTHTRTLTQWPCSCISFMGQTPYNNWPSNSAWLPWCTNKSFYDRIQRTMEHGDTICNRQSKMYWFTLFPYFITEKSLRINECTPIVYIPPPPPPHYQFVFWTYDLFLCIANLFHVGSLFFPLPPVVTAVFIFQENPIENCSIASFQFASNHHCTLVWSSAKGNAEKCKEKGRTIFMSVYTIESSAEFAIWPSC